MNVVRVFQVASAALLLPAHSLGQPFVLSLPPITDPQCAAASCALNPEESAGSQNQGRHSSDGLHYAAAVWGTHNQLRIEYDIILIADAASIVGATSQLVQTARDLGIIDEIKSKLLIQKDEASKHLAVVLGEIARFYQSVDVQISKLLSIEVYQDMPYEIKIMMRERLTELNSTSLKAEMNKIRGSCSLIKDIHRKYLDPWFQRVTQINSQERTKLNELFRNLDEFDGTFIESMDRITTWIDSKAEEALDYYMAHDYDGVSKVINSAYEETKDFRKESIALVDNLYRLQREFLEGSGGI